MMMACDGGEGKVRLFSDNRSLQLIVRSLLLIVRSLLLTARSLQFSGVESVISATCFCLPYSQFFV